MKKIKVYFVSKKSNYKNQQEFDCYDEDKNAFNYPPVKPAIYHPPCRLFSKLRYFSTAPASEKYCALWSMYFVRVYGGIVEHPYDSLLWKMHNINQVNVIDEFGGFWLVVDQHWFGFPTRKRTGLYIVGINPNEVPRLELKLYQPTRKFEHLSPTQRSSSPPEFINFLKKIILLIKK